MVNVDPELLNQLRGPKDVVLDLDFHPKLNQVNLKFTVNLYLEEGVVWPRHCT